MPVDLQEGQGWGGGRSVLSGWKWLWSLAERKVFIWKRETDVQCKYQVISKLWSCTHFRLIKKRVETRIRG